MSKKLLTSYILFIAFAGIMVMWNSLGSYFSGVGVAFVGLVGILGTTILLTTLDKTVATRTKDLLITASVFLILEFLEYIIFEFQFASWNVMRVFMVIQNIISFFSLLFLAYAFFRLIAEARGLKLWFGSNKKKEEKKQAKEISNGSLEDKPNRDEKQEVDKKKEEAKHALFDKTEE